MRLGFFVIVSLMLATPAGAQEATSLETFLSMSPQELETVQVQIDYLGPTNERMPPLIFSAHHQLEDQGRGREPSFTVSVEELRSFLWNVESLLMTERTGEPWLSITVANGVPHRNSLEAKLDQYRAKELFVLMRGSLHADPKDVALMEGQANLEAMRELQSWGCGLGLLPVGQATDVTDIAELTIGHFQLDPPTGRYTGQVHLKNSSTSILPAPVSIVFGVVYGLTSSSVRVADAHGTTCNTKPVGRQYVYAPLPHPEGLLPGESVKIPIVWENSEEEPVVFTFRVLAGSMSR